MRAIVGPLALALLFSNAYFVSSSPLITEVATFPAPAFETVPTSLDAPRLGQNVSGTCGCNIFRNSCDGNCCCDSDCSASERAVFTFCLPEGPKPPEVNYCVDESSVYQVNLPGSGTLGTVVKEESKGGFINELMCVKEDNGPPFGYYFADPPEGSSDELNRALNANAAATEPEAPIRGANAYRVGGPMRAWHLVGAQHVPLPHTYFSLPAPTFSAFCDALRLVRFMENIPSSPQVLVDSCDRSVDSLAAACDSSSAAAMLRSPLSAEPLVNALRLASNPAATQPTLNISITTVTDMSKGGARLERPLLVPEVRFNTTSRVCSNVVQKVVYTFTHNGKGVLVEVAAEVVLVGISAAADGSATLQQQFEAVFRSAASEGPVRAVRGSPGYSSGSPLLAGLLLDEPGSGTRQVVQQLQAGLLLPAAGGTAQAGACTGYDVMRFGFSTSSTCAVSWTLDQLRRFCRREGGPDLPALPSSEQPMSIQLLQGLHVGNRTYVGIFGNANTSNLAEWREVVPAPVQDIMTWDEATSTCTNLVAGLQYQFLTAHVGTTDNLQFQINYARMQYIFASWRFRDPLSPGQPQAFHLQHDVVFVPREQTREKLKPKVPPLVKPLPDDLFYPFTSAATGTSNLALPLLPLLSAAVTLLLQRTL